MKLNKKDNVATALIGIFPGEVCEIVDTEHKKVGKIRVREPIEFGHKIALMDIPAEGEIIKLGERIGKALQDIPAGAYVHVHNVYSIEGSKHTLQ